MVEKPNPPSHGAHEAAPAPEKLDDKAKALRATVLDVLKEYHPTPAASLDLPAVVLKPDVLVPAMRLLRDDTKLRFQMLLLLTTVDYQDHFQLVYHLLSIEHNHAFVVKVDLHDMNDPRAPSVSSVWAAADWYEREARDLFGVTFDGHPDLKPLLLWEGHDGFPGRKSFPFHDFQEW